MAVVAKQQTEKQHQNKVVGLGLLHSLLPVERRE